MLAVCGLILTFGVAKTQMEMTIDEILDRIDAIEAQLSELRTAVQSLQQPQVHPEAPAIEEPEASAVEEPAPAIEEPAIEEPAIEEPEPVEEGPEEEEPTGGCDLRSAFTLNDRYRFCRELFGNSRGEMAEVIDTLSAMRSMDEIEEYLYDTLQWDAANPEVEAFVAVVSARVNGNLIS
jgi:hypothetical protein